MTSKINILEVIACHFRTLRNNDEDSVSWIDITTFVVFPIFCGLAAIFLKISLEKEVLQTFTNVGALLAALMLNLLVLILERKTKIDNQLKANPGNPVDVKRQILVKELYYNISYTTVVSILLAALPIIALQFEKTSSFEVSLGSTNIVVNYLLCIFSPLVIVSGVHIALTFLMVLKRTFALLEA